MTHSLRTHPLSRVPFFGRFVDERFLEHRRRSSSVAGFATLLLAAVLFDYRLLRYHVWNWDLLVVIGFFAVLKTALCVWYRFND